MSFSFGFYVEIWIHFVIMNLVANYMFYLISFLSFHWLAFLHWITDITSFSYILRGNVWENYPGFSASGKIRESHGKMFPSGKSGKVREFQHFSWLLSGAFFGLGYFRPVAPRCHNPPRQKQDPSVYLGEWTNYWVYAAKGIWVWQRAVRVRWAPHLPLKWIEGNCSQIHHQDS